jgi:hypothetical protein
MVFANLQATDRGLARERCDAELRQHPLKPRRDWILVLEETSDVGRHVLKGYNEAICLGKTGRRRQLLSSKRLGIAYSLVP